MTLRLYNTLTRTKEDFTPIDPNNVRMYVCGPTVYDFAHIGNARPVIVFDVLYRLLKHLAPKGEWDGGNGQTKVTYVRNITDVDDKINARALRDFGNEINSGKLTLNEAIRNVTEKTANQFFADTNALGCLTPDEQPRATDNIQGMIDMISTLINKGHAYNAEGEVLFSVSSMADYGKLSGRKLEDQQAGARVAVEAHKKNPADFVLWKLSSADEPGWESPWGRGRPGWHIECSAMSKRYLGEVFDIHGGGLDLIFPHHENEIAQSRCAHGSGVMANVWMHNGFLQVEGQKMSKSLGNFRTIAEELQKYTEDWGGSILRFNMLKTHYRQPIDWTEESLSESHKELREWQNFIGDVAASAAAADAEFVSALQDDLNTHLAITRLRVLRKTGDTAAVANSLALLGVRMTNEMLKGTITAAGTAFGASASSASADIISKEKIIRLIEDRLVARHTKNWKESDRIRDELDAMGIAIKDNKDGTTTWEVKR